MPTPQKLMLGGAGGSSLPCGVEPFEPTDPKIGWWTVPGVPCIGAYKGKGAASYTASKVNLTGRPYDLTEIFTDARREILVNASYHTSGTVNWNAATGWEIGHDHDTGFYIPYRDEDKDNHFSCFLMIDATRAAEWSYINFVDNLGLDFKIRTNGAGFVYVINDSPETPIHDVAAFRRKIFAFGVVGPSIFVNGVKSPIRIPMATSSTLHLTSNFTLGCESVRTFSGAKCMMRLTTGGKNKSDIYSLALYGGLISDANAIALQTKMMAL